MIIYWALVGTALEFVSSLVFFKLFLYEEICQSGAMTAYVLKVNLKNAPIDKIKDLTMQHGVTPGMYALNHFWMLAPWCYDPFWLFYKGTEYCMEAFE